MREIPLELLGLHGSDPFYGNTHSARGAMYASQLGQAPVVSGSEPPRILTGIELRFGEHTFDVKFPKDATVLHVLRKYPHGYGDDSIKHNPVVTIIYEDYYDEFKTIGAIVVPEFASYHQEFGYELKKNESVFNALTSGAMFAKDTVIASSSTVDENGLYGIGVNANVIFRSSPGTIEDGFVFCKEFLEEQMVPTTYSQAVGGCGRRSFFLNMYGDENRYQPFPDIGQRVRDDGVVFAVRDIDDLLAPAEMTSRALREFDRTFDRGVIAEPGSIVKDINVYWDERQNPTHVPLGMETQLRKYYDALKKYHSEIISINRGLLGRRKDKLRCTPEFQQLVVEAMTFLPQDLKKRKLSRMYRLEQLDEWRVEITYATARIPSNAAKYSDTKGGKGIACVIKPRSEMPVDAHGNTVDVEIFGGSTFGRANFGRLYEHYWNAASRDLAQRLRVELGLDRHAKYTNAELDVALAKADIKYMFNELLDFYAIVTPTQREILLEHPDPKAYVRDVLRNGFSYLYAPVTENLIPMKASDELIKSRFKPLREPLTFTGVDGITKTTEDPMVVGILHMITLEKIGEDWSSVASVKTQQYGLPAKLNNNDKNSTPGRESATRAAGESETRSLNCTVGAIITNELLDQTNNPDAHMAVIQSILEAEHPSNIERAVDRNVVPYGNSRSVALMNHLLECRGLRFKYAPSEEGAEIDMNNFT